MSVLACNSDTDERVPGGQPCAQDDQCEDGWVCYREVCRQGCSDHRECAKTEACEPGVCLPVANYECDEDADCNEPTGCGSIFDAECYAGECHYSPCISAPAQVRAQSGDQQVTLTWEPVAGADTYNLCWAEQAGVTLGSNRVSDVTSPFVHAPLANSTGTIMR
jgi:hypothetical protein